MPVTILPKSVSELLNYIDCEWSALMHVVDELTPEQMTTPDEGGWSPKDNLAHLTEWMKILLGYHMDRRPPYEVIGAAPKVTKDWDMDVINKYLFERNRRRPPGEVMDELKRMHTEVITRLKATPFDDLMEPRYPNDPEKQPLMNWVIGNTSAHFSEHRLVMENKMKK
jgi:hypothetical protein